MDRHPAPNALRQYQTLLVGSMLGLLLTVLAMGQIAWRNAQEATDAIERTQQTHQILEALLRVRVDTNRLLTDLTVVALAGERAGLSEWQAEARIKADIAQVREGIAQQVSKLQSQQTNYETAPELMKLRRVEAAVEALVDEFDRVSTLLARGARTEATRRIVEAVDKQGIGGGLARNFRAAIQDAIDQEEAGVRIADERARAAINRSARTTRIAAILGLVFAGVSIVVLLHRLRRPLDQLTTAARAVARGELGSRVTVRGDDEFAQVARAFNSMLDQLQASRESLEAERSRLEAAVQSRTQELSEANAALRTTDAVRRKFLADISHELRTPLTIIRGEAEVALRGSTARASECELTLLRIVEQAEHTSRLVNDLLFIARSDANQLRLNAVPTPLDELVDAACHEAFALSSDRRITVIHAPRAPSAVVHGDPVRLRQLLHILLDNSKRYGAEDSTVRVGVTIHSGMVQVSVADQGPGIPTREQAHVFDRFYRGANSADREGSGLGLTMAKAIVEAHRGSIRLQSQEGIGTVIDVFLPSTAPAEF